MRLNPELLALLTSAGVGGAHREPTRDDLIVVQNLGAVPPVVQVEGDFIWNRGFDIVVLSDDGEPSHFCKCRHVSDAILAREIRLLSRLSQDPSLRHVIPETRGARSARLQVQVSRHLPGATFTHSVRGLALDEWIAAVDAIIRAAELVCTHATSAAPELLSDEQEIDIGAAAEPSLRYLASAQLSGDQARALGALLSAAGRVTRRLQHGDLWPGNVILVDGSPQLLDFEMFGRVQVPLFDACHLVRTATDLRRTDQAQSAPSWWLDSMTNDELPLAVASRRLLGAAADRNGLSDGQAVAALVFYVVDMAARIHQRRGLRVHWEPFVNEARRIADALRAGALMDWIFFGRC